MHRVLAVVTALIIALAAGQTPAHSQVPSQDAQEVAKRFLLDRARSYSLRADLSDLQVREVVSSQRADHVRYQQLYQGVPVYGASLVVHLDKRRVVAPQATSRYQPSIQIPSVQPSISANDAATQAIDAVGMRGPARSQPTSELVVYPRGRLGKNVQHVLAWEVKIPAREPLGDWDVFIDATTGAVLDKFNRLIAEGPPEPRGSPPAMDPQPTPEVRLPRPVTGVAAARTSPPSGTDPGRKEAEGTARATQPATISPSEPMAPTGKVRGNVAISPGGAARDRRAISVADGQPHSLVLPKQRNHAKDVLTASPGSDAGWNTIVAEGFEGGWPSGRWAAYGDPTWDDDDYQPHAGARSAWAARGGQGGVDPRYHPYPDNTDSWMVYGPVDLADASEASMSFFYWNQSETGRDHFGWYASVDDVNYYGFRVSGDSEGWKSVYFDLGEVPGLGSLVGRSQIWVAFLFTSDGSGGGKGPFVDDVVLEKYVPPVPNLVPYKPEGWEEPLVLSSVQETHTTNALHPDSISYVDWAVANQGSATASDFFVSVYFDGLSIGSWYVDSLPSGYYVYGEDWVLPLAPTEGWHTLKVVADPTGVAEELNEGDNGWEQSFYWGASPAPNLVPYTPSGWDFPIVPSSVAGTHRVGTLYSGADSFLDWAVLNNEASTSTRFYVDILLDGSWIGSWYAEGLGSYYYGYVEDWVLPVKPAPGTHTLKIVADSTNAVAESSEEDNRWEGAFTWTARTPVSTKVFDPNPVVTSRDTSLADNNNMDSPALTSQLIAVPLQGLDRSGYLRGDYADLTAVSGGEKPSGRAYEPGSIFDYTRSDDRFEEVMVYYHLDRIQRYIQGLGFANVNNRSQPAHAHFTSQRNAFYSSWSKELWFGDGGVDMAEDADVIAHEYGHAIQDNQVPGWGQQYEGLAMGEGFSDYWAASLYADASDGWHKEVIADWAFAPNGLRVANSTRHYPDGMDPGRDPHADGEIWSGALWEIWNRLGRTATDRLVLDSHFGLDPQARFGEGVDSLLLSDRELNAGANVATIADVFRRRGILDAYELDNEHEGANWITPDGASQTHGLHSVSDVDWVKFNASVGYRYSLRTSNLQPNADTVLELYGTDGTTLVASNDDCALSGLESCIQWVAPSAGTYYARVRPHDSGWTGRDTNYRLSISILGTPPSAPVPQSPGNGSVLEESDAVALSWSGAGEQFYGEVSGGPAGGLAFGWQSGTAKNLGPLPAGYGYSWRVKARNTLGESAWSDNWNFTVRPSAPSEAAGQAVSYSQIDLSWRDNSAYEQGYRIFRNGALLAMVGPGTTRYQDQGLNPETAYSYLVKAFRGDIESAASNSVTVATLPKSGRLRVVELLTLSDAGPYPGGVVTARFKVKNVGGSPVTIQQVAAGARFGNNWDAAIVDFPHVYNRTLEPLAEYAYDQSRSFSAIGSYFAEPIARVDDVWASIGGGGRVQFLVRSPIVGSVSMSPADPFIGETVTAVLTVKNVGVHAVAPGELAAAVRLVAAPAGTAFDFGHLWNVVLQPGREYRYEKRRTFGAAGDYFAEARAKINNLWVPISDRSHFTVRQPLPGKLQLSEPLTITPSPAYAQQGVTARFKVRNVGEQPITVPGLVASVSSSTGARVDFPQEGSFTLQPNQERSYQKSRSFSEGGYTAEPRMRSGTGWQSIEGGTPVGLTVQRAVPGKLRVTQPLTLLPGRPRPGESTTASFTIKNEGGQPVAVQELTAAVRLGSDWNGPAADFPHGWTITLQPGQEYLYRKQRSFSTAGSYFAEPRARIDGIWGPIEGGERVSFGVGGQLNRR